MANVVALYELQKIDLTGNKVRRRLLKIQKLLTESEELRSVRDAVAQTGSELQKWQTQQKDAELESQALQKRIQDTDQQLMSGSVTNPKELESLQASLEALRRQRTSIDDAGMESMTKAEELSTQLVKQQSVLQEVKQSWKAGQKELKQEGLKLQRNYQLLKQKRESSAKAIDPALLSQYEQMRKRKGGVAVAAIESDSCGACNVQIPTGIISRVQSNSTELVKCTSCGRILYVN